MIATWRCMCGTLNRAFVVERPIKCAGCPMEWEHHAREGLRAVSAPPPAIEGGSDVASTKKRAWALIVSGAVLAGGAVYWFVFVKP